MKRIVPSKLSIRQSHALLTAGVAPRPIALVSTISSKGIHNVAPFSFFNVFGLNPPVVGFSPTRRGRDGTLKDTYKNLIYSKECVVHVVTSEIVEKANITSADWSEDVSEFDKAGLKSLDSELVAPKRVKESPFHMECKLIQMVHLGEKAGSGNLAICEVLLFHVEEGIYKDGVIDPNLIDLVGRHGSNYYTRACGDALFELSRPKLPQNEQ